MLQVIMMNPSIIGKTTLADGEIIYSEAVLSKELNAAFVLIQGKSATYYSDAIPPKPKKGDVWFCTGNVGGYSKNTLYQYNNAGV